MREELNLFLGGYKASSCFILAVANIRFLLIKAAAAEQAGRNHLGAEALNRSRTISSILFPGITLLPNTSEPARLASNTQASLAQPAVAAAISDQTGDHPDLKYLLPNNQATIRATRSSLKKKAYRRALYVSRPHRPRSCRSRQPPDRDKHMPRLALGG